MKKYLFILASLFLFMNLKAGPPIDLIYLITNFENYDPYPWVIDADNLDNTWQIGSSYKIEFDTVYSMPNAIMTDIVRFIYLISDFEDNNPFPHYPLLTDTINPWVINDSSLNNIWQIGLSYKAVFGTTFSVPNAIMTDTINPYPINNHSSFQFLITKPTNIADYVCLSAIQLIFRHKINTDTLRDGGYIDISHDLGETWTNIIDDSIATGFSPDGTFYDNTDSLTRGKFGFSGNNTNEWISSGFIWDVNDNEQALKNDSIIIRFNFISDSINNNKAGWIIDNIDIQVLDLCVIGVDDVEEKQQTLVYPNPISDISILELPESDNEYLIRIYNVFGHKVFSCTSKGSIEISRDNFYPGIYFYKIRNPQNKVYHVGKFVVQ